MNIDTQLPLDFDGVFRFTNNTNSDFVGVWNKVEYTFPAMKTTPMVIENATPLEVQSIRKKFAKDLAVAQFYESAKFKDMNDPKHGVKPALYTDSDLAPLIQKCLEPLAVGVAKAKALPKDKNENYKVSKIVNQGDSLVEGSASLA